MISFFVPGLPIPGGSKTAFPIRRKDGSAGVAVSDASGRRGKEWRARIALAAHAAVNPDLLAPRGPLCLTLAFAMPRPKGHYGKHGVRRSAPVFPVVRPDVLKLARVVEDACTGILWHDDAQICVEILTKEYGRRIGVRVSVAAMSGVDTAQQAMSEAAL